jgi:hypothetical protein
VESSVYIDVVLGLGFRVYICIHTVSYGLSFLLQNQTVTGSGSFENIKYEPTGFMKEPEML